MANLLSTKDLQALLRVDRSTIYRMAEDGKLPAIKVGRQWRFPEERIQGWLREQSPAHTPRDAATPGPLPSLLSTAALQDICDLYADAFGTMVVITDMTGAPLTKVSNPCGLFELVGSVPANVEHCIQEWRAYSADPILEAKFAPSATFGFLCARGFIRLDHELIGMMLVGGVAPAEWPPAPEQVERMAAELSVPAGALADRIGQLHRLDEDGKRRALASLPKVCALVSRLAADHRDLANRFDAIAGLAGTGVTASFIERRNEP